MRAGFTLIELTVTIGILLVLSGAAIGGFNNFNLNQRLKQTSLTVKNNLRLSQTRAIAVQKPASGCTTLTGHQVNFSESSYTLAALCDPEGAIGEEVINLPSGITFSPLPSALVFQTLTRVLVGGGPVTVRLINVNSQAYSLRITDSGDIEDLGFE